DNFVNRYAFEQILREGSYNFLNPSSTPGRAGCHCACRPSVRDNFVNRYAFEQILREGSYNFLNPSSTPGRAGCH
ncbi:hypothetical protein C7E25_24650, partial [Stenotrophomonas maltophilia]